MAGLEVNASSIVNTVKFNVDRQSMQKAKKAIKKISDYGNKQKDFNMKFDRVVQNAKKAEKAIADATTKRVDKQVQGTNRASAAQKQAAREAAQAAKRAETAEVKRRSVGLQMGGIIGKTAEEEARVLAETKRITREYEHGAISLQRMNFLLREQTTLTRRAARARAAHGGGAAAGAEGGFFGAAGRDFVKKGSLSEGLIGGLGGAGMVGALGAGALALGVDRSIDVVKETAERNKQIIEGAKLVHSNPNTILAMQLWGSRHGVDSASFDKSVDNLKDTREKIGQSVMSSAQDPKTGKWKGGNGAVDNIMNQFGWTPDMIKKYQDNPLDFIGATVNEGQRRGMNQAQIGTLVESLGDDLMHYLPMFIDSGKQFKSTIDDMVRSGAAITPELEAATEKAADFSNSLQLVDYALSNNFLTGFMNAMGGVDQFSETMKTLNPAAKWLGSEIGDLVKQFTNLINSVKEVSNWFTKHFGDGSKPKPEDVKAAVTAASQSGPYVDPNTGISGADPAAVANANASGDSFWNWVRGFPARFNEANSMFSGDSPAPTSVAAGTYGVQDMMSSRTPFYQPQPISIELPDIIVQSTVTADSTELNRVFDAKGTAIFENGIKTMTLNLNSAVSATGSN